MEILSDIFKNCFTVIKKLSLALTCTLVREFREYGSESQKRQLETYWSVKYWSIG